MKTWCDDDSFDADPVDHACACGTSADEPHAPGCEAPTAWSRDVVRREPFPIRRVDRR